ncbi:hypothetical protein IFM89_001737 [Coptis chinensis]|uniref:SHSP domain-containing protein n=1 Tax=Coptis chinensis TaxID=261450 RepID=A0A835HHI0_9MAGN|nr:hypothetical protein IFM89_001737 [Coptis chinensis]
MASSVMLGKMPVVQNLGPSVAAAALPPKSARIKVGPFTISNAAVKDYHESDKNATADDNELNVLDFFRSIGLVDARPSRPATSPTFSADVIEPVSTPRSIGEFFGMLGELADQPFQSATRGKNWSRKDEDEAMQLKIDMPGLGKEHVKVTVEEDLLIIKGEADTEAGSGNNYSTKFVIGKDRFKVDKIQAEMKNGVLKVTVPKLKYEERKNVVQVTVV